MNKVNIFNEKKFDIESNWVQAIIDNALKIFNIKSSVTEVTFVDIDEIQKINKQYRNIDKPTDVLSFPQIDVPNQAVKIMGAIVISLEIVKEKNEDLDNVLKHGILHLLGFDHETNEVEWETVAVKIDCNM